MPGIVMTSTPLPALQQPSLYHQGTAYSSHHLPAVPSGYIPNSTHQYPRPMPHDNHSTRPLRPAERMRLRPWLVKMIEEHKIPGLDWEDEERQIVRIPWKHAARHGWVKDRDASLFKAWAIHTKKYDPKTDTPKANPKMWKANFRCAINSLPDIQELRDRGKSKGNDAYKVYRLVPKTKALKPKSDVNKSNKKARNSRSKANKCNKSTNDCKTNIAIPGGPKHNQYSQNTYRLDLTNTSQSSRLDNKLSISTKMELSQLQSPSQLPPLPSPTSMTSSQPSTPLSAPPGIANGWYNYPADGNQFWLPVQQQMNAYGSLPVHETEDYMSDGTASNMTDEELVDMVDGMIKESPTQSPINTVPSSPLDFDGNNNVLPVWDNEMRRSLSTFAPSMLSPIAPRVTHSIAQPYYSQDYHAAPTTTSLGVVKVERNDEDTLPASSYTRDPPPNYYEAVTRGDFIKEEPTPTYHKL